MWRTKYIFQYYQPDNFYQIPQYCMSTFPNNKAVSNVKVIG